MPLAKPGQIWRDDCYYLDRSTGECQRKYVLVIAIDAASQDAVTAVFTSKPNGLTEQPACSSGPPRAGYFVGTPGGVLAKPTWVEFTSLDLLDVADLKRHIRQGRKALTEQALTIEVFCSVLRCALRSDDVTRRQARLISDLAAQLGC
jgi:hypothetical protein